MLGGPDGRCPNCGHLHTSRSWDFDGVLVASREAAVSMHRFAESFDSARIDKIVDELRKLNEAFAMDAAERKDLQRRQRERRTWPPSPEMRLHTPPILPAPWPAALRAFNPFVK